MSTAGTTSNKEWRVRIGELLLKFLEGNTKRQSPYYESMSLEVTISLTGQYLLMLYIGWVDDQEVRELFTTDLEWEMEKAIQIVNGMSGAKLHSLTERDLVDLVEEDQQ